MLNKDEMRQARLRALGELDSTNSTQNNQPIHNQTEPIGQLDIMAISAAILATTNNQSIMQVAPPQFASRNLRSDELSLLNKIAYRGGGATEDDLIRWYEQGFQFCLDPVFGLKQGNGGPCGILATVQAEILKSLFFTNISNSNSSHGSVNQFPSALTQTELDDLLVNALIEILSRATVPTEIPHKSNPIQIVELAPTAHHGFLTRSTSQDLIIHSYHSINDARLGVKSHLSQFKSNFGCITFLLSLLLSRGLENILTDMDDSSNTMIGQFGHCNQDLINLLLVGRATSNVFDRDMPVGDSGLVIKGIYQRASIGYLTHLEALRYCQVGGYLKVPLYPIWVIGSTSHFTVVFSLTESINEISSSEKMFNTLRRCFKAVDKNECGFIPASSLKEALQLINIDGEYDRNPILSLIYNDTDLARFRGHIQIDGEIIVWSNFWESISKLMSGESLDSIISCPPLLMDMSTPHVANNSSMIQRSDSDIARELEAELNGTSVNASSYPLPMIIVDNNHNHTSHNSNIESTRMRSDSEIARELQAQWNDEDNVNGSILNLNDNFQPFTTYNTSNNNNNNNNNKISSYTSPPPSSPVSHSKNNNSNSSGVNKRSEMHRSDSIAGEDAEEFQLYHFNGLESAGRTARLTKFKLFRRSAVNSVGQATAFDDFQGGSSFICPIEEVIRTRWPGCRFDWMGQNPPSVD
eukprot:gene6233-8588_t